MMGNNRFEERADARRYWDSHGIDEVEEEAQEVELEVKKPLSAVITVRIDPEHLAKLKLLARAQGVGITTMARKILLQTLDQPGNQLVLQALNDASVQKTVATILADLPAPPEGQEEAYYLLSRESIDHIGRLIQDTAARLWLEALQEKSVTVTRREGELYDRIKEIEEVRS